MTIRFDEPPVTEFINNLDAIRIKLIKSPTSKELRDYAVQFLTATWDPRPGVMKALMTKREMDEEIRKAFMGLALPTALETIELVFQIEGISLQEVTHILRYRTASFSAECSGDKWWNDKIALVPNSIENSSEFYERYKKVVEDSKQLYVDMIDSRKISIMDARYILPRCLETFYYMKISLKDAIHFIKQRIDTQIQPETDNVIAYKMYEQIVLQIQQFYGIIDLQAPSLFYAKMARTGRATNLYQPSSENDIFEYNEKDFIYSCKRHEMNGTNKDASNKFVKVRAYLLDRIKRLESENERSLELEYELED